jgi:hypothetical protein
MHEISIGSRVSVLHRKKHRHGTVESVGAEFFTVLLDDDDPSSCVAGERVTPSYSGGRWSLLK